MPPANHTAAAPPPCRPPAHTAAAAPPANHTAAALPANPHRHRPPPANHTAAAPHARLDDATPAATRWVGSWNGRPTATERHGITGRG
ncbi:hypothetical protein AB0B68_18620 [Micromonospora sp. NPDC049049]|uniref:hypothetical protein n=1 Tax=Micromonospora sp. NPDC049049 TaxID=3155495 RepID=UPI0033DEE03C